MAGRKSRRRRDHLNVVAAGEDEQHEDQGGHEPGSLYAENGGTEELPSALGMGIKSTVDLFV